MNIPIEDLPSGWTFTHLIFLDPCWQGNARDDHHVCVASAETPEAVVPALCRKIEREEFVGAFKFTPNLLQRPIFDPKNILVSLGLAKPVVIKRRKDL